MKAGHHSSSSFEDHRLTGPETAPLLDGERGHDGILSAFTRPTRHLTSLEKLLAVVGIILLILTGTFVGLFAGAETALNKAKHAAGHTTTSTVYPSATPTATQSASSTAQPGPTGKPRQECVLLSANILQSLDTSVDPCDDFYAFATGGWDDANSIPADKGAYGAFNEVSDRNKVSRTLQSPSDRQKVILKIIQDIPSDLAEPTPEEANLRKLKTVFDSCQNVDALNEVGLDPLIELVNTLVDIVGPFDLVPAPDVDEESFATESEPEWKGTWDESYTLPDSLLAASNKVESLKAAKTSGQWDRPKATKHDAHAHHKHKEHHHKDKEHHTKKEDKTEKITRALAWLNSRGELPDCELKLTTGVEALFDFIIEGDAGGDDSQVQSLWFYQADGALPAKAYYEEKPVLDLYTSVVKGILVDIAVHLDPEIPEQPEKRGLVEDIVSIAAEEAEAAVAWPWPWPKDGDKGDKDGDEDKTPHDEKEPVESRLGRLAEKVVAFERELIRAGADPEFVFNPHYAYNPYPTAQLDSKLNFFDIGTYLSAFAIRSYPKTIVVTHPPYLKAVNRLVEKTPDYVLSGYLVTRLAITYATALGPKVGVRAEKRKLEELLQGLKKGTEENREDTCLSWVDNLVGFIAGGEFAREAFSPEAKKDAEDIIHCDYTSPAFTTLTAAIVDAFYDKLDHIPWMDAESAKAAQKKAKAIIPKIGYPLTPNTTDPASLAAWYRGVQIEGDDFFGNVLRSRVVDEGRGWASLGRRRDRNLWEMYPQTVNAYYSPPDGEIVFPAGILQPPFFSHAWPAHLKYGAFGAVAAHELTHAFDNSGSQYDDTGRLRDWWTNATVEAFEERAQCVASQYSKFYVYDAEGNKVYVNGNFTNGEDIADSGLAQSYIAWKNTLNEESKSERLPGLDFTDEQLFFIAFGRVWSQLIRPAVAVSRVRSDPHSPNNWRTIGTLRNEPAFHKAFGCKEGSYVSQHPHAVSGPMLRAQMRPPKKDQCELW